MNLYKLKHWWQRSGQEIKTCGDIDMEVENLSREELVELLYKIETVLDKDARQVRFAVGTEFIRRGKNKRVETITDVLKTRGITGDLHSIRYSTSREFLGQTIFDHDVCDATIAMGEIISTPSGVHPITKEKF